MRLQLKNLNHLVLSNILVFGCTSTTFLERPSTVQYRYHSTETGIKIECTFNLPLIVLWNFAVFFVVGVGNCLLVYSHHLDYVSSETYTI